MSTQLTNGQQKSKLHTGYAHLAQRHGRPVVTGFIHMDHAGQLKLIIEREIAKGQGYKMYHPQSGLELGSSPGFSEIIDPGPDSPNQWGEFSYSDTPTTQRVFQIVVFTAWRSLACPSWWYKTQAECLEAATKALSREPQADDPQERPYAFKRLCPDRTQKFVTRDGTVITPSATDFRM